ncbi:hypothetical protein [Fimbriiglobus ruber]|uniref:Uncharacterized protein n=1 Tax=Fimbriiglobus ruber TaxID=1908690 RepID=A0A225EFA3_9BACT|nr:hypothetical protein [Fimbriiglobus ruber]OWK47035.1 hypothetical protein FRUB_00734 [Fimbriiglobus ruber]
MRLTCKFEELSTDVQKYLHDVRTRKDRGIPGVFVARGDSKTTWAFIVGPFVAFVMLVMSCASTKSPWAVAMLQAAAVLLGGWTVIYAVRRWFVRGQTFAGFFTYFDPRFVYEVDGEMVTVTDLETVTEITARPPALVVFRFPQRAFGIQAVSRPRAEYVADYYWAVAKLEKDQNGPWTNPAELGAAAKFLVEEDERPRDMGELKLDFDEIPEVVEPERKPSFGFLGLGTIVISGVMLFLLFWGCNQVTVDDRAFARAKDGGAPGLRGYLIEESNTKHRDEARQALYDLYAAPIARLRSGQPAAFPKLREGMVALLESVRTANTPVLSLKVVDKNPIPGTEAGAADLVRSNLADGLGRSIGPEMIAFVAPPDGQPAHLTVEYEFRKDPIGSIYRVQLTVTIRPDLTKEPVASETWQNREMIFPLLMMGSTTPDMIAQYLCRELVGEYKPAPPPEPEEGGDF